MTNFGTRFSVICTCLWICDAPESLCEAGTSFPLIFSSERGLAEVGPSEEAAVVD